jgi:nitroreductase
MGSDLHLRRINAAMPDIVGQGSGRLETLIAAAVRAPSGDNTQPWRFKVDATAGSITVEVDETRDPSPMNAGQRMARIAAGAALENMLHIAKHNGWEAELIAEAGSAVVRLKEATGLEGAIDPVIAARVSNRRFYDARPIATETLAQLVQATPALEGVQTYWISQRDRVIPMADLIGRADALMFGCGAMRRAFLSKVRFDAPAAEPVAEGLSLASLELSTTERWALRLMPHIPDTVLKWTGGLRAFAAKARKLVESASGLCLISVPDESALSDWMVGRAMQRAWLTMTAQQMAVQPMMSLMVLENAYEHGRSELLAVLGPDRLAVLRKELRTLLPEIGSQRPAFLLRFGYAPLPSGRTGRLPTRSVTHEASSP